MIEVILYSKDTRVATGEVCPDSTTPAEDAVFAARTMWDDYCHENPYQGVSRSLRVQFLVEGVSVAIVEGRRP